MYVCVYVCLCVGACMCDNYSKYDVLIGPTRMLGRARGLAEISKIGEHEQPASLWAASLADERERIAQSKRSELGPIYIYL